MQYHRRLIAMLCVADFFEGYDFIALTQLLPNVRADFGVSIEGGGELVAFINLGTVVAWFLVRLADRWGRKRLLYLTIAGYALATAGTGLSRAAWQFGLCQFVARVFLVAEWSVSTVLVAEELPADRRGRALSLLSTVSGTGAITCAALVPLLLKAPWGWRTVYFVGIGPLLLLMLARRSGLRETPRFAALDQAGQRRSVFEVWRGPYAPRVVKLALIWALAYVCTQNAITFWKEFVTAERGFTDADVSLAVTIAALGTIPLTLGVGVLLDWLGRRKTALIVFPLLAASVSGAYSLHSHLGLGACLAFAMFTVSAVLPIMNAFTTELVPTALRGDAFAWSNNLLGRVGYVLSPLAVGYVAQRHGFSVAIRGTCIFPLLALALVLLWLPETSRKELEESASLT